MCVDATRQFDGACGREGGAHSRRCSRGRREANREMPAQNRAASEKISTLAEEGAAAMLEARRIDRTWLRAIQIDGEYEVLGAADESITADARDARLPDATDCGHRRRNRIAEKLLASFGVASLETECELLRSSWGANPERPPRSSRRALESAVQKIQMDVCAVLPGAHRDGARKWRARARAGHEPLIRRASRG